VQDVKGRLRMRVIHARFGGGFHVALVPAELSPEQVEAALHELGVEAEAVLELGGWQTAACGVAVARVPFPGGTKSAEFSRPLGGGGSNALGFPGTTGRLANPSRRCRKLTTSSERTSTAGRRHAVSRRHGGERGR
jgi:hypothetical protein